MCWCMYRVSTQVPACLQHSSKRFGVACQKECCQNTSISMFHAPPQLTCSACELCYICRCCTSIAIRPNAELRSEPEPNTPMLSAALEWAHGTSADSDVTQMVQPMPQPQEFPVVKRCNQDPVMVPSKVSRTVNTSRCMPVSSISIASQQSGALDPKPHKPHQQMPVLHLPGLQQTVHKTARRRAYPLRYKS